MSDLIQLAISTCPNDMFAFHAVINRRIDLEGIDFDVQLLDIDELNSGFGRGDFDVAKVSFFAALQWSRAAIVLPSGAALGFGVGPVLLAAKPRTLQSFSESMSDDAPDVLTIACPGEFTTAALLCHYCLPFAFQARHMIFSKIMPAVAAGEVDLGACIHEGRFTYRDHGLFLVADLGELWHAKTNAPLPLGGMVGRRRLGTQRLQAVQRIIRRSIEYARANRAETLPTMREYAVESTDEILWAHVDLYVNDWTVNMGIEGKRALARLHAAAQRRGLVSTPPLEVLPE